MVFSESINLLTTEDFEITLSLPDGTTKTLTPTDVILDESNQKITFQFELEGSIDNGTISIQAKAGELPIQDKEYISQYFTEYPIESKQPFFKNPKSNLFSQ